MPSATVEEMMDHLKMPRDEAERMVRQFEIAEQLVKKDPSLRWTAMIMAGDQVSAERAWAEAERGEVSWTMALAMVGSYSRMDFALRAAQAGRIEKDWLYKALPELWRGADPDDTDDRFRVLWRMAWAAHGSKTIYDRRKRLPKGELITIYRGQDPGPLGIAWTTDRAIAEKFARGAGLRQGHRNGNVLTAQVRRERVLAYLTGRNESEVIVDPKDLLGGD